VGAIGVKLLLDTCAFIWLCSAPENFSGAARGALQNEIDVDLFVSDASVLEIALKSSLGKLTLPNEPRLWIEEQLEIWDIKPLPITHEVIFESADLFKHHNDPFDRLIVATSMIHNLPVVTSDRIFESYGCELVW
jgi:PIN domain nuclease of toxin-antitoxin system